MKIACELYLCSVWILTLFCLLSHSWPLRAAGFEKQKGQKVVPAVTGGKYSLDVVG